MISNQSINNKMKVQKTARQMAESISALGRLHHLVPKSGFIANVLTLTIGTVLAQAIRILATPIITRLYTPEHFGAFALFNSVTVIVAVIACLRYEQAIVLPRKDEQAANVLALSLLIVVGMTLITTLVMSFGRVNIARGLGRAELAFWLCFIPFGVLFRGVYLAFAYWSTRKRAFGRLAISRMSRSLGAVSVQIAVVPMIGANVGGLIVGNLLGSAVASVILGAWIWGDGVLELVRNVNKTGIKTVATKYRRFPYYSSWTELLHTFSQSMTIWLLAYFFTPVAVGCYSLTNRVLRLPIDFIAGSVRQVYFQKASELHSQGKSMKMLFIKSSLSLLAVGIVPFSILSLFGKALFAQIFGTDWSTAGNYVQIMSPWLFSAFINAPAKRSFDICQKQNMLLTYRLLFTISVGLAIVSGYYLLGSAEKTLLLLSFTGIIYNVCVIGHGYYLVHQTDEKQ